MANSDSERLSDDGFRDLLRGWIVGFHGEVKPMSQETISKRVDSYFRQEELYREKVEFIRSLLPIKPNRVLDLGSSAGGLSVALAQSGLDVEGVEPSAVGVEASEIRATRLGIESAKFRVGYGESLPFASEFFDLVVSIAVLEHVQDVQKTVEETFRVLTPGGTAYFEVPNYLFPFEPHYKIAFMPMMPLALAKLYVRLRGMPPSFLDTLNFTNRLNVFAAFKKAGFEQPRDAYADFLVGKAKGAPWSSGQGRLARNPWLAGPVRLLCGMLPTALFINRAVYLVARKPF